MRKPPSECQEAEFSVLGSVMLQNAAFFEMPDLEPEDFHDPRHGVIWAVVKRLVGKGEPVDPVTLSTALEASGDLKRVGGVEYLLGLAEAVATSVNCAHHARIVLGYAARRRLRATLVDAVKELDRLPPDEVGELRDRVAGSLLEPLPDEAVGAVDIADAAETALDHIRRRYEQREPRVGIPSGLTHLDDITAGWEDGDLITLGAYTGHGKTMAGCQFAADGARLSGRHSLYISLEVPADRIARRLLASFSGVNAASLKTGLLLNGDIDRVSAGAQRIRELRGLMTVVHCPTGTVDTVQREVRRYQLRRSARPLGLVVVDYAQRLQATVRRHSRQEEVADIARGLKAIAGIHRVPVLALAQLNRELTKRADKRPTVADLRDSSELAQEASLVVFLHRPDLWGNPSAKGKAEFIVDKARDGESGCIAVVGCRAEHQRFFDLPRDARG